MREVLGAATGSDTGGMVRGEGTGLYSVVETTLTEIGSKS